MKTPDAFEQSVERCRTEKQRLAVIVAIQSDAREDLLKEWNEWRAHSSKLQAQNSKMREILESVKHQQSNDGLPHCFQENTCPACRWEAMKKEMNV